MFSFLRKKTDTESSPVNEKLPALFCMDCFNSGKIPLLYSLCRNNDSTKLRYIRGHHQLKDGATGTAGKKPKLVFLSPRQVEAKNALENWRSHQTT